MDRDVSRVAGQVFAAEIGTASEAGIRLERWALAGGRDFPWRHWSSAYSIVVAELLLQRTRAEVVALFIPSFLERFPGWPQLASADLSAIDDFFRPLFLFRLPAST